MAGYGASFEYDSGIFESTDGNLRAAPRLLQTALKRREKPLKRMALRVVAVDGKPVTYPVPWTTPLQRKAFFATDGFGRGIPTGRSGELLKSWDAAFEFGDTSGAFSVWNTAEHAPYVVGDLQQPMFAGRWVHAPSALDEFAPVVVNDVEQTLLTVLDPLAGVR